MWARHHVQNLQAKLLHHPQSRGKASPWMLAAQAQKQTREL